MPSVYCVLHYLDINWSRHKICWEDRVKKQRGPEIMFDGTPFVILSSVILECQFGRDMKKAEKRRRRHAHAKEVV